MCEVKLKKPTNQPGQLLFVVNQPGLHYLPPRPLLSPTLRRQFLLPPPLSVAPDVLASAVSQAVGQVLQPLMERVEQLESAAAVVPPVNSSSVHAVGHPPAARPSLSVLPDKLRGRIERGEFIDFDDLLPDQLGVERDVVQLAVGLTALSNLYRSQLRPSAAMSTM